MSLSIHFSILTSICSRFLWVWTHSTWYQNVQKTKKQKTKSKQKQKQNKWNKNKQTNKQNNQSINKSINQLINSKNKTKTKSCKVTYCKFDRFLWGRDVLCDENRGACKLSTSWALTKQLKSWLKLHFPILKQELSTQQNMHLLPSNIGL